MYGRFQILRFMTQYNLTTLNVLKKQGSRIKTFFHECHLPLQISFLKIMFFLDIYNWYYMPSEHFSLTINFKTD